MVISSVYPTNVFSEYFTPRAAVLTAHLVDPLCQARVEPGASLSTGHRLDHSPAHAAQANELHMAAGLHLQPLDTQQTGCSIASSFSLSPVFCFSLALRLCLQSPLLYFTPLLLSLPIAGDAGIGAGLHSCISGLDVLLNPHGEAVNCFLSLVPCKSGLISSAGGDTGREAGQAH